MLKSFINKIKLWHLTFLCMIGGTVCGVLMKEQASMFLPLGIMFINMIKMIMAPLIFFAVIYGILNIKDTENISKIAVKTSIAFILTSSFAVLIGITVMNIMKPGRGVLMKFSNISPLNTKESDNFFDITNMINTIVPDNIIKAMTDNNTIAIIFFAFFFGIVLRRMNKQCPNLVIIVQNFATLFIKMVQIIVKLAPLGVFGYMAHIIGTQGFGVLISFAQLIFSIVVCCIVQYLFFGIFLLLIGRLNPIPFYKKIVSAQLIAFSTTSSKAALGTLMEIAHSRLGMSKANAGFLLPISAALNMDGGAIYLTCVTIFFAQVTGKMMSINDYLLLGAISTLGSIGCAGIPSGIILFLSSTLRALKLPLEGVGIIAGIDRILDMFTTAINTTGDIFIAIIIDKTENTLDLKTYHKKFND